jgi:hypothetical protein
MYKKLNSVRRSYYLHLNASSCGFVNLLYAIILLLEIKCKYCPLSGSAFTLATRTDP